MNKQEFLAKISRHLRQLPTEERNEIVADYVEYFTIGVEEGKREDEIAASLGSPKQVAKELLADYHIEKMEKTSSTGNLFRAVWAVIGLGFVNLFFVLGPFLVLFCLLVGGWLVSFSCVGSPLLVTASSIANPGTFQLYDLFVSIALSGLGLFIGVGMYYASISVKNTFLRYLKFNVAVVKGGAKA